MTNVWWKIDTFYKDSKILSLDFDVCSFCRVYREVNSVAHALAKFISHHSLFFCCNFESLPPSVLEAWLRNVAAFSV